MDRWELAVPNREERLRGMVLLGVGLVVLGIQIYDAVAYDESDTWRLVLAVLALVSGWRIMTMGLYVSQRGVRVRLPYQTKTFDWFEIRDFENRTLPPSKRLYVWVIPKMGEAQRTPVHGSPEVLDQMRARLAARSVDE